MKPGASLNRSYPFIKSSLVHSFKVTFQIAVFIIKKLKIKISF